MKKIKRIKYSKKDISRFVVYPDANANKYSRGHAYIIAGSDTYPGAAILCSRAAERAGSGYTSLFTEQSNVKELSVAMPSIPTQNFSDINFCENTKEKPCAYLIGSGFVPQEPKNEGLLLDILSKASAPVIIDGGALSHLNNKAINEIEIRLKKNLQTIITPHEGEANTILDEDCHDYKPEEIVVKLAEKTHAVCVLKGPNTFIYDNNCLYEFKDGTSALAKAGSGDVLAGILVGILCQGKLTVFDTCVLAANVHAKAASVASEKLHTVSVTPQDLIDNIPASFSFFN